MTKWAESLPTYPVFSYPDVKGRHIGEKLSDEEAGNF